MSSVSGLGDKARERARDLTVLAAREGLEHASSLTYTQKTPARWDGIDRKLSAARGECPRTADCSGFATWCLWNGLYVGYGVKDVVNGGGWAWGNTASMMGHGKQVMHLENVLHADLVIYGNPYGGSGHVAVAVGGGKVISFGGDPGPRFLDMDYRAVTQVRRFI